MVESNYLQDLYKNLSKAEKVAQFWRIVYGHADTVARRQDTFSVCGGIDTLKKQANYLSINSSMSNGLTISTYLANIS